tara:strand:- start:26231 stop:27229 length:999 start_codon:yes stop_codon:yes gene_type:complete
VDKKTSWSIAQLFKGCLFGGGDPEGSNGIQDQDTSTRVAVLAKASYPPEVAAYYEDAVEKNCPNAQYNLGEIYQEGIRSRPPDMNEAIKWYTKAARQGHPQANMNLALLYEKGMGVDQSFITAARIYLRCYTKLDQKNKALARNSLKAILSSIQDSPFYPEIHYNYQKTTQVDFIDKIIEQKIFPKDLIVEDFLEGLLNDADLGLDKKEALIDVLLEQYDLNSLMDIKGAQIQERGSALLIEIAKSLMEVDPEKAETYLNHVTKNSKYYLPSVHLLGNIAHRQALQKTQSLAKAHEASTPFRSEILRQGNLLAQSRRLTKHEQEAFNWGEAH